MRVAWLIPWIMFGLGFVGQLSSLFGQSVETLVHDVSGMADGSVMQARLEAQRQVASGGLPYRSYKEGDYKSFSGRYTPPELPDDKKGEFVYGLALFSDDGCNVTVKGSPIHKRLGKGQHLPNIGDSFHELQVVLAPGEPVDITVDYSNIFYDDDPDSPGYPDIDGCTLFLYLIPAAIAVDANRDGTIAFSGEARDATSQDAPFRFWCNDDQDQVTADGENDVVPVDQADHLDDIIQGRRDLEDFARLWLHVEAFSSEIADGTFEVGLKWKDVTGAPAIKVYKSADITGSTSYLTDETPATAQVDGPNRNALGVVANGGDPLILPADFWSASGGQNANKCLIFEGSSEGKGQLVVTIQKSDGREVGEGTSVWLDLVNIKKMYARASATPDTVIKPYESDSPTFDESEFHFTAESFNPPSDEEKKALVFVHGWNQSYEYSVNFAETMFKRLWHQGFEGRFCAFRWATLTSVITYNTSEYRAWKYGRSLQNYVTSLPDDYVKNVAAHSMGNVVTGSALQRGMSLNCYFLMEAAVPGGCFNDAVNNYQRFLDEEELHPTADTLPDLGYRLYLQPAYTNVTKAVNFYNVNDFALATGSYPVVGSTHWEQNQISYKPNANLGIALGNRTYAYDSGPPNNPHPIGLRCFLRDTYPPFNQRQVMDIHESMAYVARPRSKAIGAEPKSEDVFPTSIGLETYGFGGAQGDHSGQFNRSIQQVSGFYKTLFDETK